MEAFSIAFFGIIIGIMLTLAYLESVGKNISDEEDSYRKL